jgi:hypothetical protein
LLPEFAAEQEDGGGPLLDGGDHGSAADMNIDVLSLPPAPLMSAAKVQAVSKAVVERANGEEHRHKRARAD